MEVVLTKETLPEEVSHFKSTPSTINTDYYHTMKSLEKQLEFVSLQEEYLKDEMRHLQRELLRAKEEIRRIQSVPLVIGQFNEMT